MHEGEQREQHAPDGWERRLARRPAEPRHGFFPRSGLPQAEVLQEGEADQGQ